ncbi:MAG: hypothetical protein ABIL68_17655 [bacterium]
MEEHNQNESSKLSDGAKWVIRQLLLEVECRNTRIDLYDAEEGGYVVFYRLVSGDDSVVEEYARKLSIQKSGNRLEVQHG